VIVSEQWLREWVRVDLTSQELSHRLTMGGLEVDALEEVAASFSGVIVAEIVSAEPHPDADKLRVCQVETGSGVVQIVCGAPNACAGLKAPLAQVGAVLPGDFKIKKAKLRGVESQGMLCAAAELTISEDNAGLMALPQDAPVGTDLREYLALDDHTIEIGLTPNRADCLSIAGLARDLAVLTNGDFIDKQTPATPVTSDSTFDVSIEDTKRCPRYLGRVIEGVDLSRPSPLYIQERLRRSGIRAIDAAVDITNYVMLELGQPLHAFDLDVLAGGIVVRTAQEGETLVLLDGSEQALSMDTLLIADQQKPLALAGIMGGEHSGVSAQTTNLFLESAFFTPELLAGVARRYGLHTDASHRFERGVDPELAKRALEVATALLLEVVGGEAGPITEVCDRDQLPCAEPIRLHRTHAHQILGFEMADERIESILLGLGFTLDTIEGGWSCQAPSWRFDMEIEADLIEELARVHGYDDIPLFSLSGEIHAKLPTETIRPERRVKRELAARGFSEVITFSFIAPDQQCRFDPDTAPVALRNPISSDLAVMRTSLIPGLLNVLRHNFNRQQRRLKIFESGLRFLPGQGTIQEPMLALAMTGARSEESWSATDSAVDFYDLKGEIEALFAPSGAHAVFVPAVFPGLHDGQTAEIIVNGESVGVLGRVHPDTAGYWDLPSATYVAQLKRSAVCSQTVPQYTDISRFPEVRRDIAVLLSRTHRVGDVVAALTATQFPDLQRVVVFDVYAGQGVPEGMQSVALGLTFQNVSRTLDDAEITGHVADLVAILQEQFDAVLRS
jgi:phenylalanyl-tRNA synthetase beta chain